MLELRAGDICVSVCMCVRVGVPVFVYVEQW